MKKRTVRILSAILAAIMVFSMMPMTTFAETSGDFEYIILDDGTAEITGYNGNDKILDIPSSIDGYAVTRIGISAFAHCESVTSVTVPDSVTFVGDSAFRDCPNLEKAVIGNGVTSVENGTFENCGNLTSVVIGNSVTSLGWAFGRCFRLENITLPDSLTNIYSESIFADTAIYCNQNNWVDGVLYIDRCLIKADSRFFVADEYTIADGTRMIADEAFFGRSGLHKIVIPDSVRSIGNSAFNGCGFLSDITIGNGVTRIGYSAFNNTPLTSSESEYWVDGVLYFTDYLIAVNRVAGDYTIADGTKVIADHAFEGIKGLTGITIPDSVTNIGIEAFKECPDLKSATIGSGVKRIGEFTFFGCTNLEKLTLSEGVERIDDCAFDGCTGLANVRIPGSVKYIGDFAFYDSLISAAIPGSVTSIGFQAFGYISKSSTVLGVKADDFIIYGEKNSAAEDYANENGIIFMDIENYDPDAKPTEPDTLIPKKDSNIEIITVGGENVASIPAEREIRDIIADVDNKYIRVIDDDGETAPDLAIMGTGRKIQVLDSKGKVLSEYTALVLMDINGDGKITASDARSALRTSAKLDNLEGVFYIAADADCNDKITASDARKILRVSAKLETA